MATKIEKKYSAFVNNPLEKEQIDFFLTEKAPFKADNTKKVLRKWFCSRSYQKFQKRPQLVKKKYRNDVRLNSNFVAAKANKS